MTQAQQTRDEDNAVVDFITLAAQYEIRGSVERLDPPRPDFVIKLDSGLRVGLEITEATEAAVKRHVTLVKRLSNEIEAQMRAERLTGRVSLRFSHPLETPTKLQAESRRTATEIVTWIQALNGAAAKISQRDHNDASAHWSATFGLLGLSEVGVVPAASAWVMPSRSYDGNDRGCVITALRRKEAKLPGYKAAYQCAKYWLLVISGGHFADPSWDMIDDYPDFRSSFDRVFFLERRWNDARLNELQTKPP